MREILKKYKTKIVAGVLIVAALIVAFFCGGDLPKKSRSDESYTISEASEKKASNDKDIKKNQDLSAKEESTPKSGDISDDTIAPEKNTAAQSAPTENNAVGENAAEVQNSKDDASYEYETEARQAQPEKNAVQSDKNAAVSSELTCTLSVRCDTVLNNLNKLNKDKINIIPQNGVIFPETTVVFYEGESVFNILQREMKRNKIHMEFENTPIYKSAYIEGIANLYEYDCGELSGWMYRVNGVFPNYGASRYTLKSGDRVEWVYTCDLGADIGDNTATRNGR